MVPVVPLQPPQVQFILPPPILDSSPPTRALDFCSIRVHLSFFPHLRVLCPLESLIEFRHKGTWPLALYLKPNCERVLNQFLFLKNLSPSLYCLSLPDLNSLVFEISFPRMICIPLHPGTPRPPPTLIRSIPSRLSDSITLTSLNDMELIN